MYEDGQPDLPGIAMKHGLLRCDFRASDELRLTLPEFATCLLRTSVGRGWAQLHRLSAEVWGAELGRASGCIPQQVKLEGEDAHYSI